MLPSSSHPNMSSMSSRLTAASPPNLPSPTSSSPSTARSVSSASSASSSSTPHPLNRATSSPNRSNPLPMPPQLTPGPGSAPPPRYSRPPPPSVSTSAASSSRGPAPSPPSRPQPAPRPTPLSQQSMRRPPSAVAVSPPESPPSARSPTSSSSVHHRFHTSSSTASRPSPDTPPSRVHSIDGDEGYSPKRKKGLGSGAVCAAILGLGLLLLVLSFLAQSLPWMLPSSSSLRPLRPAVSIHHPLIPPTSGAVPRVNLTSLLTSLQMVAKRLPYHPPLDQPHTRPPPPEDVPLSHPWYVPPPIELSVVIPRRYERLPLAYVTNVTPKPLRKVAVPGNDPGMGYAESQGEAGTLGEGEDGGADGEDGPSEASIGGVKVVAGVKMRAVAESVAEWTEEQRTANRKAFAAKTLNVNLYARKPWKPAAHTLSISKDFPPPVRTADQFIFGDDFRFILLTEKKNHGLVRKIMSTWGQYVQHWTVYSDWYDAKLNTTVLKNPQPTFVPRDYKYSSWRISAYIGHLAKHPELHKPFYMVIDQYSFPVLDQIMWRLDEWKAIWKGQLPDFIAGRPDKKAFTYAYWPEQQEAAAKLFSNDPLQVIPMYAYGFSHASLTALSYYTPVDVCPVLQEDNLALAGLIACAGGLQLEYHFLAMTRSNHREKQLTANSNILHWRMLDVYSQTRTGGMVEEAFSWYYGNQLGR